MKKSETRWDDTTEIRAAIEDKMEKIKEYGFHDIHAYLLLASILQSYREQCFKLVEKVREEIKEIK